MFILRRILKNGSEINTNLGNYYILQIKEKCESEFNETVKMWSTSDVKSIYGVVVYDDGASIMPLYNNSKYYIMTSDGRIFDNISN